MHELPLVFFTVLAQASVGIVVFATVGLLLGQIDHQQHQKALFIALISLALGGVASLFHLGQPFRAINALSAVGQSPMSNEIIATILFGTLLFVALLCNKTEQKRSIVTISSLLASMAGVGLAMVIPQVYLIESVGHWNTPFTSISMILTAVVVGASLNYWLTYQRLFSRIAIVGLLTGITILPSYFSHISLTAPELLGQDSMFWMSKLLFAGLAIISLASTQKNQEQFASLAVAFVITSEVTGRIGFFDLWQMTM